MVVEQHEATPAHVPCTVCVTITMNNKVQIAVVHLLFVTIVVSFIPVERPTLDCIERMTRTSSTRMSVNSHNQNHASLQPLSPQKPTVTGQNSPAVAGVVAPLLQLGPYPAMALRFPQLKDLPVLHFVLDTGATVNSIRPQLVQRYDLKQVILTDETKNVSSPQASGIGGNMTAGEIFLLGDTQLHGLPGQQDNVTFVKGLTAASLSSPADGILGLTWFRSFPAVVLEFHSDNDIPSQTQPTSPQPMLPPSTDATIQFLLTDTLIQTIQKDMIRVPLLHSCDIANGGLLWISLSVKCNDGRKTLTARPVIVPAMVDTGSPVTILSLQGSGQTGIATVVGDSMIDGTTSRIVVGMDGAPILLRRSQYTVDLRVVSCMRDGVTVPLGCDHHIWVGPVLPQAPNTDGPAIVLGCDYLMELKGILLQLANGQDKQMWLKKG